MIFKDLGEGGGNEKLKKLTLFTQKSIYISLKVIYFLRYSEGVGEDNYKNMNPSKNQNPSTSMTSFCCSPARSASAIPSASPASVTPIIVYKKLNIMLKPSKLIDINRKKNKKQDRIV